jgi:hypothetical protein
MHAREGNVPTAAANLFPAVIWFGWKMRREHGRSDKSSISPRPPARG